jgi:ATP-dependent helicase/nuclease subunit A
LAKVFSIYRSSAGSGKTRTLAKEYLKLALRYKADYFRYILAVTFTNKASQEMKDRILAYLDDFAKGKPNELATELKNELNFDDQTFEAHSQETQAAILHGYAQFSISTIDAFFQKVIRAFTRESGLIGDYRLEVENDAVLEAVVDNLIDELGTNEQLTNWVVEFAKENLENERAWDVRLNLIEFAKEIFREEFKEIEEKIEENTTKPAFFKNLRETLWQSKNAFFSQVATPAKEALEIIDKNGFKPEDFSYGKNSGLITFFSTFAYDKSLSTNKHKVSDRMRNYFTIAENWAAKKSLNAKQIRQVASEQLVPRLIQIIEAYDKHFTKALSAEIALKNLYVFGLIADISRKLKEYKDENNIMLLADAPKFLNGVIQDSDTPFIYEKVGSFYKNYLIDEFQDTSGMQWKNFQPLITNSLDQGFQSLLVGDVKQAIYRWRGGDLNLLQQKITDLVGAHRTEVKELNSNFRSAAHVVNFNNEFFKTAALQITSATGATIPTEVYKDVSQQIAGQGNGFVHIEFITEPDPKQLSIDSQDGELPSHASWSDRALEVLPHYLEQLQSHGAQLKEIAILVRKNEEGQRIAAHLLQYKTSPNAKAGCRYDVVSNESLRIDGAASVNLLLGAMAYLLNPEDAIARAQLAYEFSRVHEPSRELAGVFAVTNQVIFENNLPERFSKEKTSLKKLPLIELTETLIDIFKLGSLTGELIYLQAFQDLVLEFYSRERNDLGAFLEWWHENKHKKSVQISGEVDAIQILTIHKSKGLQFKYVIIPFCSWGLDHDNWQAPNLWVTSEVQPFADAGYIPVRYAKNLEETCFKDYYREEKVRTYLDNLNLLYVAFTRAEQGMIVMAPSPDVRGVKETVATLVYNCIQLNESLRSKWREDTSIYQSSAWEVSRSINKRDDSEAVNLLHYHAHAWREKLVIRQVGSAFFSDLREDHKNRINYGIHMHAVLSRIRYSDEIVQMLDQIVIEGLINEQEKIILSSELKQLLDHTQIANWFSKSWEVRTEVPVLLPGGKENRIDRLLIKDKHAIIVDFKTGDKKKSDEEQVLDYINVLRQMNFTNVEGYLLYLRDKQVLEVKQGGKPKIVRRNKDKNQLSLNI